jgi:hypothetical protein
MWTCLSRRFDIRAERPEAQCVPLSRLERRLGRSAHPGGCGPPVHTLTNAFSKKIDAHVHALSLYFVFYNFAKTRKAHRLSPAMTLASLIASRRWKTLSR